MKKKFNKPEEAAKLHLGIVQAGEKSVIRLNMREIPDGYCVDDIIQLIEEKEIMLVDAPREHYEYYPLHALGEVLVNCEGRKIYILDVLDTQYYFRDLDAPNSRYYEDFKMIDTYFCRDDIYEVAHKMKEMV